MFHFQVQQSLAQANVLNKFLEDEESVARVQEVFTGLYTLDFVSRPCNRYIL